MLFAFVDESYTRDRYYVGAYVVDENQLSSIKAALDGAGEHAAGFGVAAGAEFHGYEIMSGHNAWKPIRGQHRAAISIYRRALDAVARVPTARLFIEGVDITRLNARYSYPEPPHRIALRHVLENVDNYARGLGEEVIVIEDEIPDQDDHARRAESYLQLSTGGYKPSRLATIQMPIRFGSSAESPGLQAIDLAGYLFRRMDAHVEKDERARQAVLQLWRLLRPLRPATRRWDP